MTRNCPKCDARLGSFETRCPACGHALPETLDRRSQPESPHCGVCGAPIALMALSCPDCGAGGYPALRGRRGKKSLGSPESEAAGGPPTG